MELSDWFKGFEKGIAHLSPEQRSAFFSECGKNCMNGGTLSIYRKLYEDAGGDMDIFFQLANGLPGCKKGYITTPMLCECSRQSVLYSLQSLWKGRDFQVKLCHSILQGGKDCKMRIEAKFQYDK